MKTGVFLRICALGFAVSTVMFFILVIILIPFDFAQPIDEIMAGEVNTASDTFGQFIKILPIYYALDSVLIVGWFVGWVGVSMLVGKRNRLLGGIILVFGLAGPLLDFLENEISWTVISVYGPLKRVPPNWHVIWRIILQLSFIFPYSAAVLTGICLWSEKTLNQVATGVGILGLAALAGMYIPFLEAASHLWWPIWFTTLSLLLWRRGKVFLVKEKG